MEMYS